MISGMGNTAGGGAQGPTFADLARQWYGDQDGRIADPSGRDEIIGIDLDSRAFGLTARRAAEENASGSTPTFVTSMFKYYATELGSRRSEATIRMYGMEGAGWEGGSFDRRALRETRGWLGGKAGTIAGGSSEVQLNIIAKRVLGLPD